jgi:hypothetical protein
VCVCVCVCLCVCGVWCVVVAAGRSDQTGRMGVVVVAECRNYRGIEAVSVWDLALTETLPS